MGLGNFTTAASAFAGKVGTFAKDILRDNRPVACTNTVRYRYAGDLEQEYLTVYQDHAESRRAGMPIYNIVETSAPRSGLRKKSYYVQDGHGQPARYTAHAVIQELIEFEKKNFYYYRNAEEPLPAWRKHYRTVFASTIAEAKTLRHQLQELDTSAADFIEKGDAAWRERMEKNWAFRGGQAALRLLSRSNQAIIT
jgi:hypothetical protein